MQTKVCTKCKKEKLFGEFNKCGANRNGLRTQCKQCDIDYAIKYRSKNREKINAATREWYKQNKSKVKEYHKRYREKHLDRIRANQRKNNKKYYDKYVYGLDENTRLKIYDRQKKKCAICGKNLPFKKTNIDHNHKTGEIRGILCSKCNIGLGYIEDNEFNRKAKEYLKNSA